MKVMYVYIVKCADQSYYTGVTNDIERRLAEHNSGEDENAYIYHRRPVELVFCEMLNNPNEAIELEKQIKGWTRKKKEALIQRNWSRLKELAVCKNFTSHKYYSKNKINASSKRHGSTSLTMTNTEHRNQF
ncbi:MAG: GIY-YIG nuclease family protein [Chitinophagales bacterium]|nr:GIY-YIG nuclease family protein [Chitinophagales bacterium]